MSEVMTRNEPIKSYNNYYLKGREVTKRFKKNPDSELNEFEPRLKSPKNWFQLNAGLNLETLNTILSGTNHI